MKDAIVIAIDDNEDDLLITERILKKFGVDKLFTFQNGPDALKFIYELKSKNTYPKLIFLDLKLPKISGFDILKTIKQNNDLKCIPVIILTTSSEKSDIIKSYNLGANGYIIKPLDYDKYSNILKSTIEFWININTTI